MINSRQFPFRFLNAHDSINDFEAQLEKKGIISLLPTPVCLSCLRTDETAALVFSASCLPVSGYGVGRGQTLASPKDQDSGQAMMGRQEEGIEAA